MNAPPVPAHTVTTYTKDIETERYVKEPTIVGTTKAAAWVRISKTRDFARQAVGAELMAEGPTKNKVKSLHAGLIPTGLMGWYVTDIPDVYKGRTCRNTAVFHFTADARMMVIYLFTGLEKFSIAERVKFAIQVIPNLVVPSPPVPQGSFYGASAQRPTA